MGPSKAPAPGLLLRPGPKKRVFCALRGPWGWAGKLGGMGHDDRQTPPLSAGAFDPGLQYLPALHARGQVPGVSRLRHRPLWGAVPQGGRDGPAGRQPGRPPGHLPGHPPAGQPVPGAGDVPDQGHPPGRPDRGPDELAPPAGPPQRGAAPQAADGADEPEGHPAGRLPQGRPRKSLPWSGSSASSRRRPPPSSSCGARTTPSLPSP